MSTSNSRAASRSHSPEAAERMAMSEERMTTSSSVPRLPDLEAMPALPAMAVLQRGESSRGNSHISRQSQSPRPSSPFVSRDENADALASPTIQAEPLSPAVPSKDDVNNQPITSTINTYRSTRSKPPPPSAFSANKPSSNDHNSLTAVTTSNSSNSTSSSEKNVNADLSTLAASDTTRVQRNMGLALNLPVPILTSKKSTSPPSSTVPRKPWTRPVSSPYGTANSPLLASYTSSVSSHNKHGLDGAASAPYIEDHDPGRWHTDAKEADDFLHDPEKPIVRHGPGLRGLLNVGTLCLLLAAILMLFMGYPLLTEYYFRREGNKGGFNLGGSNSTGQVPDLGTLKMRQNLVDADTPNSALTKAGLGPTGLETWNLVFSDEFNTDGRSFYPGDDPIWEAQNLYAHGTGDYEWYDPAAVTTKGGALTITVTQQEIHNLNFRSGQLTTWNKFCFTGGYLEAAVILPGDPTISGWWPAIWTMGNLGRANYGATTDGTWPYSYNTCDRGTLINQTDANGLGPQAAITGGGSTSFNNKYHTTMLSWQPGQRLSACTCPGEDHPGPQNPDGSFVGRSAPEIDMFEAQIDTNTGGTLSLSCQFMPASNGYKLVNTVGDEYTLNQINGNPVKLNTYHGSILQMSASGVASTNQQSYQNSGRVFSVWGFEYEPGNDGYVTWWIDGRKAWTLTAAAVGADALAGIAQRPIPEEPMYILMNVALSSGFGNIDWPDLKFPATMEVDYMRLYQAQDKQNTGCDPPNFPTAAYINRHMEAYTNPNYTVWGGTQATGGYGANWPRNRLYNNGNGCAEAPRNYPGRFRTGGYSESPVATVPQAYSGDTAYDG